MKIKIVENGKYGYPEVFVNEVQLRDVAKIETRVSVGEIPRVTVTLMAHTLEFEESKAQLLLVAGGLKYRVLEVIEE